MKTFIYTFFAVILLVSGCSEERLEPDPLSFFSPENTLNDKAGLEAVIVTMNLRLRSEYAQRENHHLMGEWNYSDMSVNGAPPNDIVHNMELQMTPNSTEDREVSAYWNLAWQAIKDANIVVSRVDLIEASDEDKNELLAQGYFGRAYWYYRLVHQFGDVPLILEEINTPRLDFYSHSRETILEKITEDLEFAVQWLPENVLPGEVNRAAGSFLLTKCYLALREFDKAIAEASRVIDGGQYALMTERFGTTESQFLEYSFLDPSSFDVIWDLHQKNNKSLPENTEGILVVQDQHLTEGNVSDGGTAKMRDYVPVWWQARDPSGTRACTDLDFGTGLRMIEQLGRGVGRMVPSQFLRDLRLEDPNDLRYSQNNWFGMERYIYNDPNSAFFEQPFDPASVTDIRQWYPIAYSKMVYIDETGNTRPDRASSDEYVFRLAELYLLRAEAHWWNGNIANATADVNVVRARAQAMPVATVDIDYIFDERARELYTETPRKSELTRVAYIMAQTGTNGYSLASMHESNWFYDRVISRNNFYRDEILQGSNIYRIRPYHVYWPIKEEEIRANSLGHINQAMGYPGSETNIEPLTDPFQTKPGL
ncbi:RagB/SusD family nutrient uptake outer membrane protein [Fulvivirgaceae bacterium BMA12]|uniref:RagB/SusD family nutrient uptake outer membrane protein n=1 Tax=Agaribacillus aureus TaxID=3051825 RepID=A0ABT8L603_9BACT|nr:RagB/SusD family nutrient uptake outer membrane protein [Fulvivirgaceae bacterium BMA12]